jgi:hypothetical protein
VLTVTGGDGPGGDGDGEEGNDGPPSQPAIVRLRTMRSTRKTGASIQWIMKVCLRKITYAPAPLACICALSCGSSPAAPVVTSPDPPLVTRVTLASDLPDTGLPTVRGGDVHTFTATAEGGTPPIEFRWIANGIVLRGWRTDMSFSWDGVTTADGLRAASGRMYFWVEARSAGRFERDIGSAVLQFDVLDCQGVDRFAPVCNPGR